jgi:LysM repeat protein
VGAAATKCLVCGADLTLKSSGRGGSRARARPIPGASAPRLPHPLILILLLLLVAGGVLAFLYATGRLRLPGLTTVVEAPTATVTASLTAPPPATASATATETPVPTDTPLPPVEYAVVANDTCVGIAVEYNVSAESIITLNNLDPNCNLAVGRVLLIPQPTPTVTPLPTATLGGPVETQVPRVTYTVHAGDTLQAIANFYGVTVGDLMEVNGIANPNDIQEGQVLIIPTERIVTPGPTPTATPPPPWPAPNQLLPADGAAFAGGEVVTLQWTSVGTLRADESYFVTVEDVTCNCARFYRQPTTETKLIVPASFKHTDDALHVYRWTVTTVRQRSSTGGQPEFDPAGASSAIRDFVWMGGAAATAP